MYLKHIMCRYLVQRQLEGTVRELAKEREAQKRNAVSAQVRTHHQLVFQLKRQCSDAACDLGRFKEGAHPRGARQRIGATG
jgi:hypothetical protein